MSLTGLISSSVISFIVLGALSSDVGNVAFADSIQEPRKKALAKLRFEIKALQQSLGRMHLEHASLTGQLQALEREHGEIARSLADFQAQSEIQKSDLKATRERSEKLRQSLRNEGIALADELRSAYMMGNQDRLKLVLNQEDPARINRLLVYYYYWNRERVAKFSKLRQMVDKLRVMEVEQLGASAHLTQLIRAKQHERSRLDKVRSARNRILEGLDFELRDKDEQLAQLKEDEARLVKLLTSLRRIMDEFPVEETRSLPFHELRGQLRWPITGRLIKRFGAKRKGGRWDGVLIAAREGTPVRVISRGRVAFSDWLRGYGFLTIVDHGDGYMSLYAFNQSLYKDVGDWVETAEIIASVGQSGGRSEPGLYFGIRKRGEAINPDKWCKKIRGAKAG